MNASSKFPRHQCSSEENRRTRDSNRLSIGPLKNITMPIRWITKSIQPIPHFNWIHVRRMKTRFQVRAITILDFIIQIARWWLFIRYVLIKHVVYFNGSPTGHCLDTVESGAPNHDGLIGRTETANSDGRGGVGVCVFASVRERACMRACAMCLQYTIMIFYTCW